MGINLYGISKSWKIQEWLAAATPFGSTRHEYRYFQPANDLMGNLEAACLTPCMFFDGLFGISLLELTLAEPEDGAVAEHIGWKISSLLFVAAMPRLHSCCRH